ncbi:hypothetical protein BH11MYX2_BH11MYX2_26570 [soil metagenome]
MGTLTNRDAVVKTGDVVEGRYRIIKTLGEGGMGTVFLAEHALIKRRVAIKILHPELATDADVIERFMNEARAAGTLGHPNIVESTDMGFTAEHVPYIVFEYLEGTLLTDEVYRVGGLPVRRAVRIAQQIASALYAAHNANIVHRDLKSDNVFLTDKDDALDHVKVLDFGISRFLETDDEATRLGTVMGTPEFMAPEQITDPASVDKRADIYALGVLIYEMLTARRPFSNDEDPRALMHRIVNNAPPPLQRPEVPHALGEMILNKMLAKNPADRYQSMMDVEAALDSFVTAEHGRASVKRSRLMAAVDEGSDDIARRSDLIPRPTGSLNTPWPAQTGSLDVISLPQPIAKKPWLLYGVAAAGLALGAGGLILAMTKGNNPAPIAKIEPAAVQQPLPAAATMPAPRDASHDKVAVQLSANAPNARVTFRRRVSAAPSTMQITPSDIVELVEVSAPGYKTTRYWLTFDRPTTLNAKLAKGAGNLEATEEDTLVALGEMAAPTQAVAAAAPTTTAVAKPAAAAKVAVAQSAGSTPGTATVARTTRKIGHAGEEQEETKADATSEAIVAANEEKTEVAMTEAKAKAEPPPVAEPAKAEPAPTKAELPEAPTAAAKSDAIPVAQPAQNAQVAVAQPSIDRGVISSVISQHRIEVLKCFAEGKKSNTSMKGTVNLTLNVDAAGKVHA